MMSHVSIIYVFFVTGHCGQMGASVKQPGPRVSETEVSMEPNFLCGVFVWMKDSVFLIGIF